MSPGVGVRRRIGSVFAKALTKRINIGIDNRVTNTLIAAEPGPLAVNLARTALVIIDMQRDFLEPGGFGASLGNDVGKLAAAIRPCQKVLAAARKSPLLIIHTREGHRPDLSCAPKAKIERGAPGQRIGSMGPMGRILVRGEPGHDIIAALYPQDGEPIVDKPGKGAFFATDLALSAGEQQVSKMMGPQIISRLTQLQSNK